MDLKAYTLEELEPYLYTLYSKPEYRHLQGQGHPLDELA